MLPPINHHAHTLPNQPPEKWEPLFTPFGEADTTDPSTACSGQNHQPCPHCQNLAPNHGHLNKVAHLTATFAAKMLPKNHHDQSSVTLNKLAI